MRTNIKEMSGLLLAMPDYAQPVYIDPIDAVFITIMHGSYYRVFCPWKIFLE